MKKIEQLEEHIEGFRTNAAEALVLADTWAEEEYANGYLDALQDAVNAIEGVWGWTSLKN